MNVYELFLTMEIRESDVIISLRTHSSKFVDTECVWPVPQTKLNVWCKSVCEPAPQPFTAIWLRAMAGLLKKPLLICRSVWREIINILPLIHWVRWGPRTRIAALLRRPLAAVRLRLRGRLNVMLTGGETRWPRFFFVLHSNLIFNILLIVWSFKSV